MIIEFEIHYVSSEDSIRFWMGNNGEQKAVEARVDSFKCSKEPLWDANRSIVTLLTVGGEEVRVRTDLIRKIVAKEIKE